MQGVLHVSTETVESILILCPSRPNPGRREKIKFLFSHFFVVPQKVL